MPSLPQRENRWWAVVIVIALFVGLRFAGINPWRRTVSPPRISPMYSAEALRDGVMDGQQFQNQFFDFTVPIPSDWMPLSADELTAIDTASAELTRQRHASGDENAVKMTHSHHIFGLRRKDADTLAQSPGLIMLAEPAPGIDVKSYVERMAREVEQTQNLSARMGTPYTLHAKRGVFEALDLEVSGNGVTGFLSVHGFAKKDYVLSIMLIANDATALAELKQIVAGMEM